jgi:solute carrier family 25 citrate transporter 1
MAAGVAAGVAESVTVVTPGENLKTKIVDDRAKLHRYKSSTHALRTIIATEGLPGLYRGVLPVTVKQSSNAFVRFTSYNAIVDNIGPIMERNGLSMIVPATAGASAGVITVYATMPFDNVKTRMQALDGKALYRSTWHCFSTILHQSGVRAFWKGTTPRLVRLSVS